MPDGCAELTVVDAVLQCLLLVQHSSSDMTLNLFSQRPPQFHHRQRVSLAIA